MKKNSPHIAVVASNGLGDALIFLIIANNLVQNGYQVTFYSSHLAPLSNWISQINLKPFPSDYNADTCFREYDLVLADFASFITERCPEKKQAALKNKIIFIGTSRVPSVYVNEQPEKILESIKNESIKQQLLPLCQVSGCHLSKLSKTVPMAERIFLFCKHLLKLQHVTKKNGMIPLENLTRRKNKKRIIIHPESRNKAKNWWSNKYIKLAKKLKKNGYNPVFIVSPDERKKWIPLVKGCIELPIFSNIDQLAQYVLSLAL